MRIGQIYIRPQRWATADYRVSQKVGHRLMAIILTNLTGRFLGEFVVKLILQITPHLAYVAKLLCETLMSAKRAIKDKLQGSVATYLRGGWVVNNQIRKGLLLSLRCSEFFKLVNIWHSYKQERGCNLVHFLRLLGVCWSWAQSARDNHVLACNFAKYSPMLKFFHSQTQQ